MEPRPADPICSAVLCAAADTRRFSSLYPWSRCARAAVDRAQRFLLRTRPFLCLARSWDRPGAAAATRHLTLVCRYPCSTGQRGCALRDKMIVGGLPPPGRIVSGKPARKRREKLRQRWDGTGLGRCVGRSYCGAALFQKRGSQKCAPCTARRALPAPKAAGGRQKQLPAFATGKGTGGPARRGKGTGDLPDTAFRLDFKFFRVPCDLWAAAAPGSRGRRANRSPLVLRRLEAGGEKLHALCAQRAFGPESRGDGKGCSPLLPPGGERAARHAGVKAGQTCPTRRSGWILSFSAFCATSGLLQRREAGEEEPAAPPPAARSVLRWKARKKGWLPACLTAAVPGEEIKRANCTPTGCGGPEAGEKSWPRARRCGARKKRKRRFGRPPHAVSRRPKQVFWI